MVKGQLSSLRKPVFLLACLVLLLLLLYLCDAHLCRDPPFHSTPPLLCSQHPPLVTHRVRASALAPEFSRQPSSHGLTQPVAKEELRPRGQAHDITRAAVKSGPCLHARVTGSSRPWDLGMGWTPCLVAQAPPG